MTVRIPEPSAPDHGDLGIKTRIIQERSQKLFGFVKLSLINQYCSPDQRGFIESAKGLWKILATLLHN